VNKSGSSGYDNGYGGHAKNAYLFTARQSSPAHFQTHNLIELPSRKENARAGRGGDPIAASRSTMPQSLSSGPPMTLGNMRENGMRTLAVWCLGRCCNHFHILDVSAYPDDVPVPSFGPRLRCDQCGHLGADARPNWNEMHKQDPITRSSSASR